jgi:serine/threonine protein kinase
MNTIDQIAGYQVLGILGHGASSTIYAVMDPRDQQVYAIKRVVRRTPSDQRFVDQAIVEHETLQQFDHETIRKSYKIIRKRKALKTSELLVLMEMVDGTTLEQHRPDSIKQTIRIFRAAAEGLDSMHRAGYVHCDIKPNNILVSGEMVKVIDLGQSCPINTVKQRIQGTPDYIAPEQVLRLAITAQTDIFNLGATMYWCVTNRHVPTLIPKSRDEVGLKSPANELVPPAEVNPKVPKALNALILHCLKTEPKERPRSMQEVADRLGIVLHQIDHNTKTGVAMTPPTRRVG